jgi:hypothetical protein
MRRRNSFFTRLFQMTATGIALGFSMFPVGAATMGSASLQDFRITVEDLNLNDGIQAGYSFSSFGASVNSSAQAEPTPQTVVDFANKWSPIFAQASSGSTVARAEVGNDFLSVSGSGYYAAHADWRAQFSILPNTRLVFSADAHLSASIDSLVCDPLCQSAEARIQITDRSDRSAPVHDDVFSHFALAQGPSGDLSETHTESIFFSVENTEAFSGFADIDIHMETSANSLQPIPEPSTYALMLAGIGLCAAVVRRRKTEC